MHLRFSPRDRSAVFAGGILALAAMAALYLFPPFFLQALDNRIYDTFLRVAARQRGPVLPVIVDVDDASLARYGQWPWPRYRVAALLERIRAQGPLVVGIDFLFSEPDRASLNVLADQMRRELGIDLDLSGLDNERLDNDARLAGELALGPYVLSSKMLFAPGDARACPEPPPTVWRLDQPLAHGFSFMHRAEGAVTDIPVLDAATPWSGFINAAPDADGVVRRVPLVIACRDTVQPSLPLAMLMRATDARWLAVRATPGGLEWVQVGDLRIPVDAGGNMLVLFSREEAVERISAAEVLDGTLAPGALAGRIVLLGSTSPDLKDVYATPVDPFFPAVAIHALVLDNVLRGEYVSRPYWARGMEFLLLAVGGAALVLLLVWSRAAWSSLAAAGAMAAAWGGSAWVFAQARVYLSPLWPSLTLAAVFLPCISLKYWLEERKARRGARELIHTQGATIEALASVIETRDTETGEHILRVQQLVGLLAARLKDHPRFRKALAGESIPLLTLAAPLHDIGKIGVPDSILRKPGPLSAGEFEEMKRHAQYGLDILRKAEEKLGPNPFLEMAKQVAYTHHERWDGTGYPQGLSGEGIPVAGRLMAVVDVYDAVSSERVYKPRLPVGQALEVIAQGAGAHFDPDVAQAFLGMAGAVTAMTLDPEYQRKPPGDADGE